MKLTLLDALRKGHVASLRGGRLTGRIACPAFHRGPIDVTVEIDGAVAFRFQCDVAASDTGAQCPFDVQLPPALFRDARRVVTVRSVGGATLPVVDEAGRLYASATLALPRGRTLIGHVDGFDGVDVVGWAMWRDIDRGTVHRIERLRVGIDDREVGIVEPDLPRPDVQALFGGDGRSGFSFRVPKSEGPRTLSVGSDETFEELLGSPFVDSAGDAASVTRYVSCRAGPEESVTVALESADIRDRVRWGGGVAGDVRWIGTVFPAFSYERRQSGAAFPPASPFEAELGAHFAGIDETWRHGPSTEVYAIDHAVVYNNKIYVINDDTLSLLYETSRPPDRLQRADHVLTVAGLLQGCVAVSASSPVVYLASTGFHNYGHWLIDDLPRLAGARLIARDAGQGRVTVALPSSTGPVDDIKRQSIRLLEPALCDEDFLLTPLDRPMLFDRLYFVSPVSYHPYLKSPAAGRYLRQQVAEAGAASRSARVYVERHASHGRSVINSDRVWSILQDFGFASVDVDGLSFAEQAAIFRAARCVVGCMGAAMTSTVFCEEGSQILYLAPEGWIEPFYWDLAASNGHGYRAIYGVVPNQDAVPHQRNFVINEAELVAMLTAMVAT